MARKFTRNYKQEHKYVLIADRKDENGEDEKNPITWKFKPLSQKQIAAIDDGMLSYKNNFTEVSVSQNEAVLSAVKTQVTGWENLEDDKGEVKFNPKEGVTEDILAFMGKEGWAELGNVIINVSKFPDDAETHLGNF